MYQLKLELLIFYVIIYYDFAYYVVLQLQSQ